MEDLLQFFQTRLPFIVDHLYVFLFLGGVLEGFNTLVLGGFLASFGKVHIYIIYPLLIIAHTINGYIWYTVGYLGGAKSLDKWGHKDQLSHEIINKITNYFQRYSSRAIMFAKFTFSLEIATLIMSGSLKYDIKKFSKYNFFGSVGWVTVTVFIGYFFGQSFRAFFNIVKNFALVVLFLGLAILIMYIISMVLKKYYIGYITWIERVRELRERVKNGIDDFFNGGHE